jgi:hypothetical protein
MYPSIDELEQRKLALSQIENALLEERLTINSKLQNIENELIAIEHLIKLREE